MRFEVKHKVTLNFNNDESKRKRVKGREYVLETTIKM